MIQFSQQKHVFHFASPFFVWTTQLRVVHFLSILVEEKSFWLVEEVQCFIILNDWVLSLHKKLSVSFHTILS